MTRTATDNETARLEARLPRHVYETMQRAAKLRGMTLTGYLVATAGEEARREVEQADIFRLVREDQVRFAEALIHPPEPTERLKKAAQRHADLIARR
ncbi:DUF1778 domain-containing protein [Fodinicurvata fenggangensis]|uniref:type II toxin-antitoxin system TacA family antitoxin n=1 Tax=Fodinicurvata fenggangensis TaxID=1121830 RepID=UPI00047BA035|nr:DUF1778 domain-containing protein [Fodinicurvata fenggangensis]